MDFCVNCGRELPPNAGFCPKCGAKVDIPTCPVCGKEVDFDADFCLYCGARLREPTPEPTPAAEPVSAPEPEPVPEPVPAPKDRRLGQDTIAHNLPGGAGHQEEVEAENVDWTKIVREIVQKNPQYYCAQFGEIQAGKHGKFNWAAFFLGGIYCYFRKAGAIFWKHFKLAYALQIALLLGMAVFSGVATNGATGDMMALLAICLICALAVSIYMLICNIQCGKHFNEEYYELCVARGKDANLPDKKKGTSIGQGILFSIVLSVVFSIVGCLCAASFAGTLTNAILGFDSMMELGMTDELTYGIEEESTPFSQNNEAPIVLTSGTYQHPEYDNVIITLDVHDGVVDYTIDNSTAIRVGIVEGTEPLSSRITFSGEDVGWSNKVEGYIEAVDEHHIRAKCSVVEYAENANWSVEFDEAVFSDQMRTYPDPEVSIIDGTITHDDYYGYLLEIEVFWENTTGRSVALGDTINCVAIQDGAELDVVSDDYYSHYVEQIEPLDFTYAYYQFPLLNSVDDVKVTITGSSGKKLASTNYRLNLSHDTHDYSSSENGYYILPTDTQYITESDLYGLSREEVTLARNEIYARYGYSFQSENLRDYFSQQNWYHEDPSVNASTFGKSDMNLYEQANLETIQTYERAMGWKN